MYYDLDTLPPLSGPDLRFDFGYRFVDMWGDDLALDPTMFSIAVAITSSY